MFRDEALLLRCDASLYCLQQRGHSQVGPAISPSLLTSRALGACTAARSPSSDAPSVPESLALIREAWLNANITCGEECEPLLAPSHDELPAGQDSGLPFVSIDRQQLRR